MEDRLPRKLTAILYADVAGYSRLTGEDEEGTHRTLRTYLDLISASIREHSGRVVHYAGDAVLADFGTVVDALTCAAAIQRNLTERNSEVADNRKVQFRIGVNLGDVIVDQGEIYGDGVNVAARLESLANPGGICISDAVRTAVGRNLDLRYEFMGEQEIKNIAEPVRTYKVVMDSDREPEITAAETPELLHGLGNEPDDASRRPRDEARATGRSQGKQDESEPEPPADRTDGVVEHAAVTASHRPEKRLWTRSALILATSAAMIVVAALAVWLVQRSQSEIAAGAPGLPARPSIAVMPFDNLSGEARYERLADGITEDIITDLSRFHELFVIARTSTFAY